MATIHKRTLRSGVVVWELTHGTGTDRQRFVAGRTREEAQEALRQFTRQLTLHGAAPHNDSVPVILHRYIAYLESNRRRGTVRRYVRVLTTFCRCFLEVHHPEVKTLQQIRPSQIEEYKTRRVEGGIADVDDRDTRRREAMLRAELTAGVRAPQRQQNAKFGWLGRKTLRRSVTARTVNYELQVLRTFFRWAITRNHLFVNPIIAIERLRVPKRAVPKFLTTQQLQKLFETCHEADRRLFMAILLTGMRKGEVEHLTWEDVNFELGVIFIREKPEWGWKPKTDERLIPISPSLRSLLKEQHARRRNDGLVFPNKEGNRDTHILQKLQKVCRRAGIKGATVHALRHSFGAHLRMAGVSLADIADLLGHKDLATTQIYAKVHQEHLRQVISKLTPLTPTGNSETLPLLPENSDLTPTPTHTPTNQAGGHHGPLAAAHTEGES